MTSLLLAALEVVQGLCIATYQGLDIIKRNITRGQRKQEQARRMADSVHRTMEKL